MADSVDLEHTVQREPERSNQYCRSSRIITACGVPRLVGSGACGIACGSDQRITSGIDWLGLGSCVWALLNGCDRVDEDVVRNGVPGIVNADEE